ncbi:facilitated trehalose transporter Tret1-like [Cryptotermes secundus]|uniref:facilitated trehalose transporter Tret1-like n=1 Tax=Cryptotermes secundus TaxID=105785 RepID=UPI000CD7D737|nr:facilitated trehalose transporter Tret1-like [Cryptotermes secundus]XP_023702841.1 facilitated trehalose transporter Tret1-like [Cryptotermes secundus]XP_023702842.1 facilitated trehalose transporter Tret1-like [Cryptotermes secundus]
MEAVTQELPTATLSDSLVPGQKPENKSRPIFAQAIMATLVYITAICNGLTSGYSAVLLPQLRANNSGFEINEEGESWIVSIYIGSTSVGCLLSGVLMHLWGRKPAVQIAVSCVCTGWLLIAITSTYPVMLLGRALGGFGKGICTPAVTVSLEPMQSKHL